MKSVTIAALLLMMLTSAAYSSVTSSYIALRLDAAVRSVCPQIDGISIGNIDDRSTWKIAFHAGALCQGAANSALSSFVVPVDEVPAQVSSMQAKVALSRAGLLNSVNAWIAEQDDETRLIWVEATIFHRDSSLINRAAAAFGLSSAQVDQLFITAASINP